MTSANNIAEQIAHFAALQWHLDQGMDEVLADEPGALMRAPVAVAPSAIDIAPPAPEAMAPASARVAKVTTATAALPVQGTPELKNEAIRLALGAQNLEELREALTGFEGLAIKKTATNMVFCDGSPAARLMLVGEAPGDDEDRLGRPFVGASGQLLDRILKCIDLDRTQTDPERAIYITNILNWRPPGNRSPTPQEIELSLPFIERHIALVKPKLLIFCGGVSAKALLNTDDGISKLRNCWHNYTPLTPGLSIDPIPAIVTYRPDYLLSTPSYKKAAWQDMLNLASKRQELGIAAKAA